MWCLSSIERDLSNWSLSWLQTETNSIYYSLTLPLVRMQFVAQLFLIVQYTMHVSIYEDSLLENQLYSCMYYKIVVQVLLK